MVNNYFKSHPMYIKSIKSKKNNTENVFYKFKEELGSIFKNLNKDIKILEIGFGNGDFTYFCEKQGFKNYTGIDIDNTFEEQHKKRFLNYNFFQSDITDFLKRNSSYDIIFMSHVFEHLTEQKAHETVRLIYKSLNNGGYRINYMPNADSSKACALRYIDITHKYIYNSNSFEQILLTNEAFFSEVQHFNTLPSIDPKIKLIFKIIHPIFLLLTKVYFYGMGLTFPKNYTSEMLSIMRK